MNSYGLRIKASENKNTASGISFEPVVIPDGSKFERHETCITFLTSSAEEQVTTVKKILNNIKESYDGDIVTFLVIAYLCAQNKHPIKCMITRFVTKNNFIQESFSESLTKELLLLINQHCTDYKDYIKVIAKIASCVENFPVGAVAVKNVEVKLAAYLKDCLVCCVSALSNDNLTPTSRNEAFGLSHTVLRLLLYVIQKIDKENIDMECMFKDVRSCLKQLLINDSPMDTKSVCGILLVSMHVMENGADSWVDILDSNIQDINLQNFLSNDSSKLSLFSALATVISMDDLHITTVGSVPAIVKLTDNILDLGDRHSSESTFTLGVARTVVQITKGLEVFGESGLHSMHRLFVFVWSHLEHSTDSIQHLSSQILTNVIKFCSHLKKQGDDAPMTKLFTTLSSLDRTRKSFYLSLTALTNELGPECVLNVWPTIIEDTVNVLHVQAIQASAITFLETLLRHTHTDTLGIHTQWVGPVLRCVCGGAGAVNVLTGLLVLIVRRDAGVVEFILPYIRQASESTDMHELVCVLMLLSVVRQAGHLPAGDVGDKWRGAIRYDVLKRTAVHTNDEIRYLSLSLIVESPKSTEVFTTKELDLIVWFISYNINAQSPHFRQLVLSLMKKFFKRLDQSYKTVSNENLPECHGNKSDYYIHFIGRLTDLCFECLLPGGNYSRRHVALQILVWLGKIDLEDRLRQNVVEMNETVSSDRVSSLLNLLGDSYESNKDMALQLLFRCPSEVLYSDKYAVGLHLDSVIKQASSVKPSECVTAAYKLKLLTKKLSKYIDPVQPTTSEVSFSLLKILIDHVERQVAVCSADLAVGARHAPLYGLLHCVAKTLELIDAAPWPPTHEAVCVSLVSVCESVYMCAAPVLHSAAPEGHMPLTDQGKIRFDDGSEVTAQMVLLCAWRSVKEVSLILSTIVSKMTSSKDVDKVSLVTTIGDSFLQLMTDIKHRGAFEQVYVGFRRMLACLWRDDEPELNQLPKRWLSDLMSDIASGHGSTRRCETRRSAGLPFMIQALVVSELQVSPSSFPWCISSLLDAARSDSLSTRCHAMNILRALYRSSALGGATEGMGGGGVGAALQLAIQGCESNMWIERNSATLLFSSLMVRVFGVQRSRDGERLCVRNRMTGRIFFLRYPLLYDFMLDKLREATAQDALHPALYPVLLLLARLYPSALEGSVSILKLASFVPRVLLAGRGPALRVRQLAARALTPLVTHTQYLSQLQELFTLLSDKSIKRNFCHGTLLQIIKLLDSRPDTLVIDDDSRTKLTALIEASLWTLEQSVSAVPCYVIIDEYIQLIHIVLWKFTSLIDKKHTSHIKGSLMKLLFENIKCRISPGREVCLANAVYVLLVINVYDTSDDIRAFVFDCLTHDTYEVVLAVLNYLLIIHNELEPENTLQEHIKEKCDTNVLDTLKKDPIYIEVLCKVLQTSKYLECTQKCLLVLTLEPNTQKDIVLTKTGVTDVTDDVIIMKLFDFIENEHENFTHIYLKGLANFLEEKLNTAAHTKILEALRIMFACSLSDNSDDTRSVVVGFVERNLQQLLKMKYDDLNDEDTFELRATVWSTCVSLLEDDDAHTRTRIAHTVARTCDVTGADAHALPSRARDFLIDYIRAHDPDALALLTVIALITFDCEVCMTDDVTDECRVFDHNEKYNTNLEEAVWTRACADVINDLDEHTDVREYVGRVIEDDTYRQTFEALCSDNVVAYKSIMKDSKYVNDNPKVDVFIKRLRGK